MRTATLLLYFLLLAACRPAPVEPRPWAFEVDDGLPTHVYAPVAEAERAGHRIELLEDLVVGSEDDPNQRFGRIENLWVDEDGRIYVADAGNRRVQVFAHDGTYLATLGRSGEGPGEFTRPGSVVVAGGRVYVGDRQRKVSVFSAADFTFMEDVKLEPAFLTLEGARPDGVLHAIQFGFVPNPATPVSPTILTRYGALDLERAAHEVLVEFDSNNEPTALREGRATFTFRSPHARPQIVTGPAAAIYYTLAAEYQVMALDSYGEPRWALQVAAAPAALDADAQTGILEYVRVNSPEVVPADLNLPDFLPMLSRIRIDGHGRLHAYAFTRNWDEEALARDVPVDVYAPDGRRVFSGYAPSADWTLARGDYVYGRGVDPLTEEFRVFRWKLELPGP